MSYYLKLDAQTIAFFCSSFLLFFAYFRPTRAAKLRNMGMKKDISL
jgi:hypothetical protein